MKLRGIFALGFVGAALSLASLSQAQTFNTPTGTMLSGLPVNATATFTVSSGQVHIVLVNNQNNPTSVIQNLSDLGFTLHSGLVVAPNLVGLTSSGQERTIAGNGTYTNGSVVSTGWQVDNMNSPYRLHVLGTGVGPAHTIIGGPNGSNVYSNAGGSIAGNGPHNAFLVGPITFDLTIPGLTANDFVSAAIFSFGTTEGNNVRGVGDGGGNPNGDVPEPGSIAMIAGMGVTGSLFAASRLRRRRK